MVSPPLPAGSALVSKKNSLLLAAGRNLLSHCRMLLQQVVNHQAAAGSEAFTLSRPATVIFTITKDKQLLLAYVRENQTHQKDEGESGRKGNLQTNATHSVKAGNKVC